ncbi:hypothetical protein BH24ACT1_BH24ACT1_05410 [soil metagenome]
MVAADPHPEVREALARYQSGKASDDEMATLMQQLINTGSIQALQGTRPAGDEAPQVWATIIPVGRYLDIWIDGERQGSASNATLARYRVVSAARPARVTWTDSFTARWDRPPAD